MEKLEVGKKYRLVGLGNITGEEVCVVSGVLANGYVELNGEMLPVKTTLFGPGKVGENITLLEDSID